jgi:hypothetical protein
MEMRLHGRRWVREGFSTATYGVLEIAYLARIPSSVAECIQNARDGPESAPRSGREWIMERADKGSGRRKHNS